MKTKPSYSNLYVSSLSGLVFATILASKPTVILQNLPSFPSYIYEVLHLKQQERTCLCPNFSKRDVFALTEFETHIRLHVNDY
jgi:hypothetical protein